MKKYSILFIFALLFSTTAMAQKIGVVDTNYILSKLPQYKEAENRLNTQVQTWEKEAQKLQAEYEDKKTKFENEKVLLVGDQLKEREKEVQNAEQKVKDFINAKFGTNGEISTARTSLTKPFQDQIWNAIKTMSEKNSLGIVIDSNDVSVLFLDKKYDYTDKVLNLLIKK